MKFSRSVVCLIIIVCLYCPRLDEMYVLSARNNRVSVELLGKEKIQDKMSRFEDLTSASLSHLGVRLPGSPDHVSSVLPSKLIFSPNRSTFSSVVSFIFKSELVFNLTIYQTPPVSFI